MPADRDNTFRCTSRERNTCARFPAQLQASACKRYPSGITMITTVHDMRIQDNTNSRRQRGIHDTIPRDKTALLKATSPQSKPAVVTSESVKGGTHLESIFLMIPILIHDPPPNSQRGTTIEHRLVPPNDLRAYPSTATEIRVVWGFLDKVWHVWRVADSELILKTESLCCVHGMHSADGTHRRLPHDSPAGFAAVQLFVRCRSSPPPLASVEFDACNMLNSSAAAACATVFPPLGCTQAAV